MSSSARSYLEEMHANLGYFATWLPGDMIEVGDVGLLEGGQFRKQSSLSEMGISYRVDDVNSKQTLQYTSTKGTSIYTTGKCSASAPVADAEIVIDFARNGAFIFQASDIRQLRISGLASISTQVINAFKRGAWKREWHLIESCHVAGSATIIVAQEQSAGLVLRISAEVPLGTVPLADPKVALTVSSTRGKLVQVIAEQNIRPLYSCLRLRSQWLGETSLAPVREKPGAKDIRGNVWQSSTINELLS